MKLDELIEKFKAYKEELIKNQNSSYAPAPNMAKEDKPAAAPHMGHSSFNMDHVKHVSGLKDHVEAKKYAHGVVESSSANPKNKAKMKSMIDGSKHVAHLATGMTNHMLAHPSEGLKVLKGEHETMCIAKNGQWDIK